jgi:hypothetical protein
VNRWMFQEKYELFRRIETLRTDLMNVIDVRDLVPRVLSALEASRRVTHASLYTVDPDGSAYELAGHVGPRPEARLDAVAYRAFLRAAAPRGRDLHRGARARAGGPAQHAERGAREPPAHGARAGAAQRFGGAGRDRRGATARHAGAARRAPARGLFLGGDRAVSRGGRLHRRHLAELAGLRAHEGARSLGGARPDGGRPGPRDPQPAGLDQGRGPVSAADRDRSRPTRRGRANSSASSSRKSIG